MYKRSQAKSLDGTVQATSGWDTAIYDTEKMIQETERKVATLKLSLKALKDLKEQGAPFPGEQPKQSEAQP